MDLMKFRLFRIAGRTIGGLLLGAAILFAIDFILNSVFGFQPMSCQPETLDGCMFDFHYMPSIDDWLIAFPAFAIVAVLGIKLLNLRKSEAVDNSLKL